MAIHISGNYYEVGGGTLDPFGAGVGYDNPYPTGTPDPNYPECDYGMDGDVYDDCQIPGFDDQSNEDSQTGSIPANTCYVNGFEADCNEVASHPDHYESDDVDLDGGYREPDAPSDEGAQGVWDDDDQSYRPAEEQEAGERSFEQQYTGMNVSFNAGALSVNVQAPSPHLSTWDLRRETSLETQFVSQRREGKKGITVTMTGQENVRDKIQDIYSYAANSEECTKAFQAVGATPIKDQVNNVNIVTQSVFNDEQWDSLWTMSSDAGKDMRARFNSDKNTNDVSSRGQYGDTGTGFIGITDRAIKETDDYLSVTVIHSFIHTGGIRGGQTWEEWAKLERTNKTWGEWFWGIKPHDLRFLGEKYDNILKHCTKEGKSKTGNAQQ